MQVIPSYKGIFFNEIKNIYIDYDKKIFQIGRLYIDFIPVLGILMCSFQKIIHLIMKQLILQRLLMLTILLFYFLSNLYAFKLSICTIFALFSFPSRLASKLTVPIESVTAVAVCITFISAVWTIPTRKTSC